jgi:putative DNA primase/helicase
MDNSEIRPFSSESTESDITPDPTTAQDLEKAVDVLAKLTSVECEQHRKTIAKQFAIRARSLDVMVKERRRELANVAAGNEILPPASEPWPEPVDGAQLLDSIRAVFRRHLVLPDHADTALTLWSVGTYVYNSFRVWPRLLVTSPEKRCGKTTCLEIMESIGRRSLSASNITPAAMFRSINELSPTILIDEADTFLKNNVELRGIINSGHIRRGAFVLRCEGDDHQTKRFSTWCPMAIFMIKMPAGTIVDRSVIIQLRRKLPNETVQRLPTDLFEAGEAIRQQAERWAQDHEEPLKKADPVLPDCSSDRARSCCMTFAGFLKRSTGIGYLVATCWIY